MNYSRAVCFGLTAITLGSTSALAQDRDQCRDVLVNKVMNTKQLHLRLRAVPI
jgi:hypothetical protein